MKGGLGNQLFQYAFGRAVALHRQEKLILDLSWFYKENLTFFMKNIKDKYLSLLKNRPFVLNSPASRRFCLNDFVLEKTVKKRFFCFSDKKALVFQSSKKGFDDKLYQEILNSEKKDIYLKGYWQSHKYFEKYAKQIKEELQQKNLVKSIKTNNPKENLVAIHFRRGDYVAYKGAKNLFGSLQIRYYLEGIKAIKKEVSNPRFLIFSDDIEWVKKNFKTQEDAEYVDPRGETEDFFKMVECDHFIIANSTYSWWAAWLSNNKNSCVVAPNQWYSDIEINKFTQDIIPASWLKL